MKIFKLARNCWGGYIFLLLVYWCLLSIITLAFPKTTTVVMSLGYFCGAYSLGWRAGRRDVKSGMVSLKTAFWGGFFGIIFSVISLLIIIIGKLIGQSGGIFDIAFMVSNFLHFHFYYFLTSFEGNILVHIIPVVSVLLLYPAGYYFGSKKFSIIDKYLPFLLYKNKKQKNR